MQSRFSGRHAHTNWVNDYGEKGPHSHPVKSKSGGESGGVGETCTTVTQRVGTKRSNTVRAVAASCFSSNNALPLGPHCHPWLRAAQPAGQPRETHGPKRIQQG